MIENKFIIKVDWRKREEAFAWAEDLGIKIQHEGSESRYCDIYLPDLRKQWKSGVDKWLIEDEKHAAIFALRWS